MYAHVRIQRLVSWWSLRKGHKVNKIDTWLPVESLNMLITFYSNYLFFQRNNVLMDRSGLLTSAPLQSYQNKMHSAFCINIFNHQIIFCLNQTKMPNALQFQLLRCEHLLHFFYYFKFKIFGF